MSFSGRIRASMCALAVGLSAAALSLPAAAFAHSGEPADTDEPPTAAETLQTEPSSDDPAPAVVESTSKGELGTSSAKGAIAPPTASIAPASVGVWDVNGGYAAAGVSLRNRGYGTINLSGIPSGATIVRAYLVWSILGNTEGANFNDGVFKGVAKVGAKVGQGDGLCWGVTNGYAYRADVTAQVTGNGAYALSGFASGTTDGTDPWTAGTAPLAEGASLFVVYSKATYPRTTIRFYNGYHSNMAGAASINVPFGFTTSTPAGEARTTFIGADGQSSAENYSKVNNVNMGTVDWDGTDPPLPRYSLGNLWDTDTVALRNVVKPNQTSATVTVPAGTADCTAWVAQAFSIGRFGQLDADGDKLLDGWEANGYDADNNGTIDLNLPGWGTTTTRKDLFVEMDYMGAEAVCPCHLPLAPDLQRIRSVFNIAPVTNPSGVNGINLHLDAGPARGASYNLGGGNLVTHDNDLNPVLSQFNAIKAANFNSAVRAKIFYYMIWAHGYDGGGSSGNAFAIPNDQFVVTLGLWGGHGTSDEKVGTFIHEFGHDLGLGHGGNEGKNYKPNYLSVMSYFHQVGGVPKVAGAPYFGYSNADLPDLNENNLNEAVGLNSAFASPFKARYFCGIGGGQTITPGTANGPIDWSCGGLIEPGTVADINGDTVLNTLTGWNDWANLVYGGGAVGALSDIGSEPAPTKELTYEESQQIANP